MTPNVETHHKRNTTEQWNRDGAFGTINEDLTKCVDVLSFGGRQKRDCPAMCNIDTLRKLWKPFRKESLRKELKSLTAFLNFDRFCVRASWTAAVTFPKSAALCSIPSGMSKRRFLIISC
jgi:hypothetical protein